MDTAVASQRSLVLGRVASLIVLVLALGLFALRVFGTNAIVHEAEWWIGDLALASIFALPAFVGLCAARRPGLLLSAGILCLVLSMALLVSIVTLPLVAPGVVYLVAYAGSGRLDSRRSAHVIPVVLVASVAALALLIFAPSTTVCWRETEYADGRVERVRDSTSERASSSGVVSQQHIGPPRAGVVSESGGCTDGVLPPTRSLGALGLVAGAALASRRIA